MMVAATLSHQAAQHNPPASFINSSLILREMQVAVLENNDNKAVIEIHGSDHTVLLALKDALENDKEVALVTYAIDHPLVGHPKLIIETKKKKPQAVLLDAIKSVRKELEDFGKDLDKKLK